MKTIKILTVLVCLLIISINIRAQICNTPSPPSPSWLFNPLLRSSQTTPDSYTLRVFIHIVRSSAGSGLSSSIVNSIVSKLNADYSGTGIQFSSNGSDFINNNTFYDELTEAEYPSLYATSFHSNAIDIYILGTSTSTPVLGGSVAGVAASIPATALWVHGDRYNTTTLTHEMGHCLGLYHTHHGTDCRHHTPCEANDGCAELVNGNNASTCGDYITDTPADPRFWNGCTYNGSSNIRDANNQTYNPNPANFMAYSTYTCRNMFTSQQGRQMRDFIANTPILQNVVVPILSGPTSACYSGDTYTLSNVPTGATVQWSVTGTGFTLSDQTNNSTTVTCTNCSGQSGTLTANIAGNIITKSIQACSLSGAGYIYPTTCNAVYTLPESIPSTATESSALSYYWDVISNSNNTILQSNSVSPTVTFPEPGEYMIRLTLRDVCGNILSPPHLTSYFTAVQPFMVSPNPVLSGTPLHLGLRNASSQPCTPSSAAYAIIQVATGGVVVYPVAFDVNNGCDININGLTAGSYIIAISYDGASYGVTFQKN